MPENVPDKIDKVVHRLDVITSLLEILIKQGIDKQIVKLVLEDDKYESVKQD